MGYGQFYEFEYDHGPARLLPVDPGMIEFDTIFCLFNSYHLVTYGFQGEFEFEEK